MNWTAPQKLDKKKLFGSRARAVSVIYGKSNGTKRRELQIQLGVIARAKKIPVEDSKQNICGINKHTLLFIE